MSDTGADFTEPTALASILLTRLGSYTLVRHPADGRVRATGDRKLETNAVAGPRELQVVGVHEPLADPSSLRGVNKS